MGRVRPACGAFLLASALAVAFLASRQSEALAAVALAASPTADSERRMCLNKRTLFTTDPHASGKFLRNTIGLTLDSSDFVDSRSRNFTSLSGLEETGCGSGGRTCCMDRTTLESKPSVAYHMIRSNVSSPGKAWVADWVEYWNGLHSFDDRIRWDPFAYASTAFYVPNLTSRVVAALKSDSPKAFRSYSGVGNESMYALLTVDASTGHVWEVHGKTVSGALRSHFSPLESSACAGAFRLARSSTTLDRWQRALNDSDAPLLVKVSTPVASAAAANEYFASTWTSLPWGDVDVAKEGSCSFVATELTIDCESLSGDDAPAARAVFVEAQDLGSRTVAAYEAAVAEAVNATMGFGGGWSRALDNHVKFDLPNGWALDAMTRTLKRSGARYAAHVQALGSAAEGSIWAQGIGPLALEYGGMFDYSSFARGSLDEYDWCNASSACGPGDAGTMLCS